MNNAIIDLLGSPHIYHNTPIIQIKIKKHHLKIIDEKKNLYEVNVKKLRKILDKYYSIFLPVGLVQLDDTTTTTTIIMANKNVVDVTNTFEQLAPNVWIGKTTDGKQSLGTFTYPSQHMYVPVFLPDSLIQVAQHEKEYNVYSDNIHGNWILDKAKFYTRYGTDDNCAFYSVQGEITDENILDTKFSVYPYDDDPISPISNNIDAVLQQYRGKIILEENTNPWYANKKEIPKIKERFASSSVSYNDKIIMSMIVLIIILLLYKLAQKY